MQTVIVLGTHNSGSGLVHEYLSSRSDFVSPFGHNEFRITTDPMGINYLYSTCYKNKGFFNSAYAIDEFLNYILQVQNTRTPLRESYSEKIFKDNLYHLATNFIFKVTDVNYYALPHYKRITMSFKEKVNLKIKSKFFGKNIPQNKIANIRLLKSEKIFLKEANIFINNVLRTNTSEKNFKFGNVVLNNAGDVLNPLETTKFFTNPKIIVVKRDPRDIFASMKSRQSLATPWYDVNIFIKWYKHCFKNNIYLNKKNSKILILKFEHIIKNFEKENNKIINFLKIKKNIKLNEGVFFKFDLSQSEKNIRKYKKVLNKKQINLIENKLKKYLHY